MINIKSYFSIIALMLLIESCDNSTDFQFDDISVSNSGSIARFHIDQNYLYVAESSTLSIFDISDFNQLNLVIKILLPNEVETIFRLGDVLFLGTTTGVLFYDISNPKSPKIISTYDHLTSCDPVVANSLYAFATLRSGRNCGPGDNSLHIISIADLTAPELIDSYKMTSPYGLGLLENNLFIGEGENGMRWLDISDVKNVVERKSYKDIYALDFIINDRHITVSTTESLIQLELNHADELMVLSEMKYDEN